LLVPRGAKALVSILLQGRAQAGLTGRVSLALLEVNELPGSLTYLHRKLTLLTA
jgi:hypothetical protein